MTFIGQDKLIACQCSESSNSKTISNRQSKTGVRECGI
jgi:hypothetical protein